MEPELIANYSCEIGEGPLWNSSEQMLYWVDIPNGRIFRFDPSTGDHEVFYESGREIGGITLQADGSLLLFMDKGSIANLRDGKLTYVIDEMPDDRDTRFNDIIADPAGGVFCGTMPTEDKTGNLYRLAPDASISVVVSEVGISNGLGFSPDRQQMYYTDSTARKIYIFDFDESSGAISDQRTLVETPEGEGIPDGMTVDADGYLWSARWDGWALHRYSPQGQHTQTVEFPTKKVSAVAFGGPNLTDMYVTTAGASDRSQNGDSAGALFRVNLGIRGMPEFTSRIVL